MFKTITKEKVEQLKKQFTKNKEKEMTEEYLASKLGLNGSDVRTAIAEARYEMPIVLTKVRTYIYTTKNKDLLKKYISKLEAKNKAVAIKKNIAKRYL